MGCASSVKLYISQISVEPSAGFSVIGLSPQSSGTGLAAPSSVPSCASTGPSKPGNVLAFSLSDTCRVLLAGPRGRNAGNVRRAGSWLDHAPSRRIQALPLALAAALQGG